jgi:N utilization substance protein A
MRVQSIIRELHGEKIDIIEFNEDISTFAEKALQPAKVSRVTILDPTEKHLEVVVDDTQLSLAIGKKGQNVRLAAKLLGWKIDIKSEEEKRQEVEQQMAAMATVTPLENVTAIGEGVIEKLREAGITTVEQLADMTPEQLEEIPGVGPKTIEKISLAVTEYFTALDSAQSGERTLAEEAVAEAQVEGAVAEAAASDEYREAEATGQALEASEIAGVEDAPAADVAEVHTHGEIPEPEPQDSVAPEEEQR